MTSMRRKQSVNQFRVGRLVYLEFSRNEKVIGSPVARRNGPRWCPPAETLFLPGLAEMRYISVEAWLTGSTTRRCA